MYTCYFVGELPEWFFFATSSENLVSQEYANNPRTRAWFQGVAQARTNLQVACCLSRQMMFEIWKKDINFIKVTILDDESEWRGPVAARKEMVGGMMRSWSK